MFDARRQITAAANQEFAQHFPDSGWVEHDPEDLWATTIATCRTAIKQAKVSPARIAAIGITNQRETTVVWDKATGDPVYNAIVWQDRRTAPICARLRAEGVEPLVTGKTGLLLDPYFSGTKAAWILDNVDGARAAAGRGELLFGTVDSYLIWRLTGGAVHATDATNASRTMLYNIREDAARGARQFRRLRRHPGRPVWPRDPDLRGCGRPAGRNCGAGVLHAGYDEIHLRHRLFRAIEHRRCSSHIK
jgi:glycerol kinase